MDRDSPAGRPRRHDIITSPAQAGGTGARPPGHASNSSSNLNPRPPAPAAATSVPGPGPAIMTLRRPPLAGPPPLAAAAGVFSDPRRAAGGTGVGPAWHCGSPPARRARSPWHRDSHGIRVQPEPAGGPRPECTVTAAPAPGVRARAQPQWQRRLCSLGPGKLERHHRPASARRTPNLATSKFDRLPRPADSYSARRAPGRAGTNRDRHGDRRLSRSRCQ
jgi:hypothetical protein